MDNGTIIVMILPAFIMYLIFVLIDELTVGNEKTTPSLSLTIPVKASAFDVMKDISAFIACQNRYRIDYFHPEKYHVVLNQGMSFRHFGFLYSIKITDGQEEANVVVGVSCKGPVGGPWIRRIEKMQLFGLANAIRASLYSSETSKVGDADQAV